MLGGSNFAPTTKGYEVSAEPKATQKFRQILVRAPERFGEW